MSICPYCKYRATEHEELDHQGNIPDIGDISFCINCGEISTYSRVGLLKIDIITLTDEVQKKIRKIYDAWIRTRALSKIINKKGKR